MNLDAFLDKLEGVKPAGNGYVAICPGHDDDAASLGVTEGETGILVNCYAGCETEHVLETMGLTFRDLFTSTVNYAEPEATYDYLDEQGNLIFQVLRFPGKKFRQRHLDPSHPDAKEDGWVWKMDGIRRVPYRLPAIRMAAMQGGTVYIVEGEKDVHALEAAGVVATCNPGGAGKWKPEYADHLRGANVIIVADRDEPGRNHANNVKASLLGAAKGIWIVQAKRGKDAYDHLVTHKLAITALVPIRERTRRGVISAAEMAEAALERLEFRETDLPSYSPLPAFRNATLGPVTFRPGRLYTLGGYTGDGKTSLALQVTLGLCRVGTSVGYFSLEMTEEDLMNRLIVQITGLTLYKVENPWTMTPAERQVYMGAVDEIAQWPLDIIFDTGITHERVVTQTKDGEYDFVIFDHVHRQSKERQKLEEMVVALTNLALELNISVLALAQLRKFSRGKDMELYPRPSLQDFRETSVLGDDSALAMAVWRVRSNGVEYDSSNVSELLILKNRHGKTGSYFVTFNGERMTFEHGRHQTPTVLEPRPGDAGSPGADSPADEAGWYDQAGWEA